MIIKNEFKKSHSTCSHTPAGKYRPRNNHSVLILGTRLNPLSIVSYRIALPTLYWTISIDLWKGIHRYRLLYKAVRQQRYALKHLDGQDTFDEDEAEEEEEDE